MILLITSAKLAEQCVPQLEKAVGERVRLVNSLPAGAALLQKHDFSVVVLDQICLDQNPGAAESLWKHSGAAAMLSVNFAITGCARVARDVRSALQRRERERLQAARAAEAALRSEVTSALTGILLSSEIALAQPALPPNVQSKLQSVHELALGLRHRLEMRAG